MFDCQQTIIGQFLTSSSLTTSNIDIQPSLKLRQYQLFNILAAFSVFRVQRPRIGLCVMAPQKSVTYLLTSKHALKTELFCRSYDSAH